MMLETRPMGDHVFGFARLLLVIAFGDAMIDLPVSSSPILPVWRLPGFVTDQAGYLARLIGAQSIQNAQQSLSALWNSLAQPDAWSILANLLYWTTK